MLITRFLERIAEKALARKILRKAHILPEWDNEADGRAVDYFFRGPSGAKLMAALEFGLRSQFENMASAETITSREHYAGTARGFSQALSVIESLRLREQHSTDTGNDIRSEVITSFPAMY
jgi:hypothetical protein